MNEKTRKKGKKTKRKEGKKRKRLTISSRHWMVPTEASINSKERF